MNLTSRLITNSLIHPASNNSNNTSTSAAICHVLRKCSVATIQPYFHIKMNSPSTSTKQNSETEQSPNSLFARVWENADFQRSKSKSSTGKQSLKCVLSCPDQPSTSGQLLNVEQPQKAHLDSLPMALLNKIGGYLNTKDILCLQKVSKKFSPIFDKNVKFSSVEIRCEFDNSTVNVSTNSSRLISKIVKTKPKVLYYELKITDQKNFTFKLKSQIYSLTSPEKSLSQILTKHPEIQEISIWDSCLSHKQMDPILALKLESLKLWNCSKYFKRKGKQPKIIASMLIGLPTLKSLLILNTEAFTNVSLKYEFSEQLARRINGPLENIQITGLNFPLTSLEIIVSKCAETCQRLSIGSTFGEDNDRDKYLNAIKKLEKLNNLDLPPFIFKLEDSPKPDKLVLDLLESRQIKSFGFRHYNSLELFNFIEDYLPKCVNVLRCYHVAHRIPYFALLGRDRSDLYATTSTRKPTSGRFDTSVSMDFAQTSEPGPIRKKFSLLSQYSFLSSSPSSLFRQNDDTMNGAKSPIPMTSRSYCSTTIDDCEQFGKKATSSFSSNSSTTSTLSSTTTSSSYAKYSFSSSINNNMDEMRQILLPEESSCYGEAEEVQSNCGSSIILGTPKNCKRNVLEELEARQLTIFAISESKSTRVTGHMKVHERKYNGVDVIYTHDHVDSQPLLGRMGNFKCSATRMPYVYEKSLAGTPNNGAKNSNRGKRIRLISGDLVKTIPFSCMGMETDYVGTSDSF